MEQNLKKNLIWNSVGSFVYLFCQWLLTFFVVRMSTTFTDAGNLSLAISITNIFFSISCFNVRPYMVSDVNDKYSTNDYVSFRVITCFLGLALCFIYILFFKYSMNQLLTIMLFMIFKIGEAIVDLFHAIEQKQSRMDIGGISLLIRGIILITLFIVGMKFFSSLNIAIILMILGTYLFIFSFDYSKVKHFDKIQINFKWSVIKAMFIEFIPLTIASFLGTICTSLPRQFLESARGAEVLGIYATVATPATIVQVAAAYIYNPVIVSFANLRANHKKAEFVNLFEKISLAIFGVGVCCIVGAYFLGYFGLNLLYGSATAKYSYLFVPIIIYTALNGYLWFCNDLLIIFRRMKSLMFVNITGFVICIAFSSVFIDLFSMNGVTIVMCTFTVVMILENCYFIHREIKEI